MDNFKRLSLLDQQELKYMPAAKLFAIESKPQVNDSVFFLVPLYEGIMDAISSLGVVNIVNLHERGEIVVDVPLIVKPEQPSFLFPVLSLAGYMNAFDIKEIYQTNNYLVLGDKKIPLYGDNQYLVNWYKPQQDYHGEIYRQIPFYAVFKAYQTLNRISQKLNMPQQEVQEKLKQYAICNADSACPSDLQEFIDREVGDDFYIGDDSPLRDKIVFIGLTDQFSGSKDLISTPLNKSIPGVFMHATIVDNFIQKDFIKRLPAVSVLFVMLFLSIATGITLLGMKNPRYGIGISFIYMLYFVIPFVLFTYFNVYTDVVYTELSIITVFVFGLGYQWFIVDKDKRQLRRVFSNYLAPQILTEILKDPGKADLGGNKKEITVLFSDIRGFTTLSESRSPEEVVQFLNEFFNAMVEEIMKNEGAVDKFIGDAIMAFWGAPVEHKNHAELAVKGALAMADRLENLKKKWAEEGKNYPEINIGIGLNTGEALVGHVGAEKIKSYTVIGDTVNLASRLEGLNKKYAIPEEKSIIISGNTYQYIKDKFNVRYLGIDNVKGKVQEVPIYKVIGTKED
jgi:class 3 adenylate cyclase